MSFTGRAHIIKSIGVITAISAVILSCCACRTDNTAIPDIPSPDGSSYSDTKTSESTKDKDSEEHILYNLKVALPYQDSTVRYLAAMYYAKKNKRWDNNVNGTNVDLDTLSSMNTDFVVTSSMTSDEGVSSTILENWDHNNAMPDLFMATDINDAINSGKIMPINDFIAEDKTFDNDRIFANCAMECIKDGKTYGIPHALSVELIAGNSDYIPGTGRPPVIYTCEEFASYLDSIKSDYEGIVPLMSASDLFPYIGSAFNRGTRTSFMLNEEYKAQPILTENVFENENKYIGALYSEGLSADKDSNGASPVFSRQCALWVTSSASLKTWEVYYPSKIYTIFLPSADADNQSPANVHFYPLCVSANSSGGKLAADFGSFISFDQDAQLLIQRLENRSGFFPVTRSSAVWDVIYEDPAVGQTSYILRQILDNAEFVPVDDSDPVFAKAKDYFADYPNRQEYSLEALYGN